MFARLVKYSLIGGTVLVGTVTVTGSEDNKIPLIRLIRTGSTAVDIARTYKSMLYNKEWDTSSEEYIKLRSCTHDICARKLLELCQRNKGVYIKIGQHIGALEYLVPTEYVKTMRVLHSNAPQNSIEQINKTIKEELRQDPKELFLEFDEEPLGTASLAQVHKAKLKDGTTVAVKVQHYFVPSALETDLMWIEFIVNTMSVIFPEFQMQWLVDETKKNIKNELDFIKEGRNAEKVACMFKCYKWLKVPKIYWEYSTDRVLVMEYLQGGHVNDLKYMKKNKINPYEISCKLSDLYCNMIFVKGFVHSDPHPGNILISKEPGDKEITVSLLDHGLYAKLTDTFRYNYSNLWLSIISRNKEEMKKYSQLLGIKPELFPLFACIVTGRPWDSIMKGIDKIKRTTNEKEVFQMGLPKLLPQITDCLQNVDRQALLVFKTNDLIRSIEYALKMNDNTVYNFTMMSSCCVKTVYNQDYQNASSKIHKGLVTLRYAWSMFLVYIYGVYLRFVSEKAKL